MKSSHIYNKYKACIHNAKWVFSHYEKYRTCYSIRSVDEEMQSILRKIAVTYARLIQLDIIKQSHVGNEEEPSTTAIIDECDTLLKDKAEFFDLVIHYMDNHREQLLDIMDDKSFDRKNSTDLDMIENNLSYANKLINRMELMLKGQQQIYAGSELILKSA